MDTPETVFEHLVTYIHSAIESEQPEPQEFSEETEKRLALVYRQLRAALNITSPQGSSLPRQAIAGLRFG